MLLETGSENYPGIRFDFKEKLITFNFAIASAEKTKACSELIALINQKAKTLKHVSSKPSETDNEKYTFRTWLIRLGMIGAKYKASRKVLLANLEGNGAFRRVRNENE